MLEALTQRGISARGAAQLLAGLQPGQAAQLPTQLEYADYLVATSVPPLRNPAGFLVALVRDNLIVPHDFAGTARQAQEAQASALREQAAETQADLEYQYEIYKEQAVAEYLAALPPAERQHLYEADKAAFLAQHPGARRWAEAVLQTTLAALRQGQLQSSLPLLEFDAFREQLWPSRRAAWEAAAR